MEKEFTFALLIDSDNISPDYYDIIIRELEELGNIKYKRVYGDFNGKNPWAKHAIDNGILPVQAFAPIKQKNATDIVMVIDAMDIFYSKTVDAFCLATSDSDFSRLSQRLKEGGVYVVVAGNALTHKSLNKSCDKFLMLDDLLSAEKGGEPAVKAAPKAAPPKGKEIKSAEETVKKPDLKQIIKVVKDSINEKADNEGWAYYATVSQQLLKKYPQFNPKLYGAVSKRDFFISNGFDMVTTGSEAKIRTSKR